MAPAILTDMVTCRLEFHFTIEMVKQSPTSAGARAYRKKIVKAKAGSSVVDAKSSLGVPKRARAHNRAAKCNSRRCIVVAAKTAPSRQSLRVRLFSSTALATLRTSWPNSWFSVAPSRATRAGLPPWRPRSRSTSLHHPNG
jgi:hypothetical protein